MPHSDEAVQELIAAADRARGGKAQDDCEVCHGTKGGVPGNENIVDGKVICDYCHAEHLTSKAQEPDRRQVMEQEANAAIAACKEGDAK